MASHEAYLRQNLTQYKYKDMTHRDCSNLLGNYRDLRPKTDTYVFNDGAKKPLLSLEGTIPVQYKGATYNIPICIWLMDTHPYNAPMCFVKPTHDMLVKPSRNVDANGRIYLPYLHEWRHPASDLISLVQVLCVVFGENSPVYSKSAAPARPAYPPGQSPSSGGALPYPPTSNVTPGYPASTAAYPTPGYPAPGNTGYTPYPTTGYPTSQYPAYNQTSNPPYPSSGYPTGSTPHAAVTHQSSISEDQIKASLISAVEDKLKRRMKETFEQAQAEMDVLNSTQEKLKRGQRTLEEMIQNLEKEQIDVEKNIKLLTEKDDEIKKVLAKMENEEEINIDEAVVPTATLYKQLLNLFAEENAIEDTIYYLGEALRKSVIGIDEFLKHVRDLSRRQFICRALMQKARQKAGLSEVAVH
ncbi:tumor susceptibility gene 101 protein-like [Saccoglossus kowalevskii]|uniref:Tumor susceptibility gene 101 protein-like n=1 Tax=Saccoglossus kowalevskii TaxID=10224 RepID=A0ABM0MH07_SACKO|nr:PREDICTED: tumor susceptibility gene 101 protein-like [Saccoglossus kowalevskii]